MFQLRWQRGSSLFNLMIFLLAYGFHNAKILALPMESVGFGRTQMMQLLHANLYIKF